MNRVIVSSFRTFPISDQKEIRRNEEMIVLHLLPLARGSSLSPSRFLFHHKVCYTVVERAIRAAGRENASLQSPWSLTGQSDERARAMKRRMLDFCNPITRDLTRSFECAHTFFFWTTNIQMIVYLLSLTFLTFLRRMQHYFHLAPHAFLITYCVVSVARCYVGDG